MNSIHCGQIRDTEREGSMCIKGQREAGRWSGQFYFLWCKQIPHMGNLLLQPNRRILPWVTIRFQPLAQLWHVDLLLSPCQTQIHLCSKFKETVLWTSQGGKTWDLVFRIYPSNLTLSILLFTFQILSKVPAQTMAVAKKFTLELTGDSSQL